MKSSCAEAPAGRVTVLFYATCLVTLPRLGQVVPLLQWGACSPNCNMFLVLFSENSPLPLLHFGPGLDWSPVSKDLGHLWILSHLHEILFVIVFKYEGLREQLDIISQTKHIYFLVPLSPPLWTEEWMLQSGTYLQFREP